MGLTTLPGKSGHLKTQPDNGFWILISYAERNEEFREWKPGTGHHATYTGKSSSGF